VRAASHSSQWQNSQRSLGWADPGRALIRVLAARRQQRWGELQVARGRGKCKLQLSGWLPRAACLLACSCSVWCACSALLSLLLSLLSLPFSLEAMPAIEWQRTACTLASRWHTTREGSYSCVQRDLEPANHACSCASLDRGLHELAGMQALRSSVFSNLHVSGLNLTQVPPPPLSPAHG